MRDSGHTFENCHWSTVPCGREEETPSGSMERWAGGGRLEDVERGAVAGSKVPCQNRKEKHAAHTGIEPVHQP